MAANNIHYLVLAGGMSRRMGQNKALLKVGPQSNLERIVEGIRGLNLNTPIYLAAGPQAYPQIQSPQVRLVADALAGQQGPLSALAAGLDELNQNAGEWLFTYSCDTLLQPQITHNLLASAIEQSPEKQLFFLQGARQQPLVAAYHVGLHRPLINYLYGGERRLMGFVASQSAKAVIIPPAWHDLCNFNTPKAFHQALKTYDRINPS